jgi:hypothetical protein
MHAGCILFVTSVSREKHLLITFYKKEVKFFIDKKLLFLVYISKIPKFQHYSVVQTTIVYFSN